MVHGPFLEDIENMVIPADLEKALNRRNGAWELFESRSNSEKKAMLYWVQSAKRDRTRNKKNSCNSSKWVNGISIEKLGWAFPLKNGANNRSRGYMTSVALTSFWSFTMFESLFDSF